MSRSPVAIDLAALPSMSLAELRAAWSVQMGRATPPKQRRLLIRELAWRTQQREHGGLDCKMRRLLNAAMRSAEKEGKGEEGMNEATPQPRQPPRRASPSRVAPPQLSANTRLVRTWRGVQHEVVALEGGKAFRYRDREYDSLSEIARAITGVRWSGPRFFGLRVRVHGKTT